MLSVVDRDILENHILPRLDVPTLASLSCVSTALHAIVSQSQGIGWAGVCGANWPSTRKPRVDRIISSFPGGHAFFFSDVYPLVTQPAVPSNPDRQFPGPMIFAVDLFCRGVPIFNKVARAGTRDWFQPSGFRIDLMRPNDTVPLPTWVNDTCRFLEEEITLSWIIIDPVGMRAADVSSRQAVFVKYYWQRSEVDARFSTAVTESKQIEIVVTCAGGYGEVGVHVRQISMVVEDLAFGRLDWNASFGILRGMTEGKRGKGEVKREEETKRKYDEFMEKKRAKRRRKKRIELLLNAFWPLYMAILCLELFVLPSQESLVLDLLVDFAFWLFVFFCAFIFVIWDVRW